MSLLKLSKARRHQNTLRGRQSPQLTSFNQLRLYDPIASHCDLSGPPGLPPVLVIRAISNYKAQGPTQLSFQAGDFFHVADVHTDINGCPWYQAENLAKGLRGIVPCDRFRKYGPQRPVRLLPIQHDTAIPPRPRASNCLSLAAAPGPLPWHFQFRSLCGIVKYNFVAERPDELSAVDGEPVVIIAQSKEWFVVKPIGRLGGPGFIPVSYVEVRDIKSGRVLSLEEVSELIYKSAIPKVDEWKVAVAAYRDSCIPLGKFIPHKDTHSGLAEPPSLSLGICEAAQDEISPSQSTGCHGFTASDQNSPVSGWRQRQTFRDSFDGLEPVAEEDEDLCPTGDQIRERYGNWHRATVVSFHHELGQYWFQVRAHFQHPDNSEHARVLVLYRLYEHFVEFDSALRAGFRAQHDLLPKLSEPVKRVDELVCAQRVEELNDYLENISQLPEPISGSNLILEFLCQREDEMELDDGSEGEGMNYMPPIAPMMSMHPPVLRLSINSSDRFPSVELLDSTRSLCSVSVKDKVDQGEDMQSLISESSLHQSGSALDQHPFDFSYEGPYCSTRPSSVGSRSGSPYWDLEPPTFPIDSSAQSFPSTPVEQRSEVPWEASNYLRIDICKLPANELFALRVPNKVTRAELMIRISEELGTDPDGFLGFRKDDCQSKDQLSGEEVGVGSNIYNGSDSLTAIQNDLELKAWLESGNRLILYFTEQTKAF